MTRGLRIWLVAVAMVAAGFAASQLAEIPVRSALRGYDNTFNYLWLRSAMVDGDWDFRNDLAATNTLVPEQRQSALTLPPTKAGRVPNKYGVGWAVLTLPFYLIADGLVMAGRGVGSDIERDGFNPVYQICIQLGHLALAVLGLGLAARTIAKWIGDSQAALAGVLAVMAASPLLYYQTVNVSMSHGAAFFAASAMAYALQRALDAISPGEAKRWWMIAGAALGLATITRFQLTVLGVVAFAAALEAWRRGRSGGRTGEARGGGRTAAWALGWLGAGAAPVVALQLLAWKSVYGEWVVFGYGAEGESFHWTRPQILGSLFSPWHGLFYWHPFLLLGVMGFVGWAWRRRGLALGWAAVLLLTAYLNAAWWCWWFASSFGNRGYDAVLLPLMAGTAWLFACARGRWRFMLNALAIGAAVWNTYVVLLYRTGAIPRNAPVTWAEMLTAIFRIPEAIQL